jgi:predicted aspartyl protease
MIHGVVTDELEAVIPLELIAADGTIVSMTALVDTGFNGDVALPRRMIEQLACESTGERKAELGDGLIAVLASYSGRVLWNDVERKVSVLAGGGPLVGMDLLRGWQLSIQIDPGGVVHVKPPG